MFFFEMKTHEKLFSFGSFPLVPHSITLPPIPPPGHGPKLTDHFADHENEAENRGRDETALGLDVGAGFGRSVTVICVRRQ